MKINFTCTPLVLALGCALTAVSPFSALAQAVSPDRADGPSTVLSLGQITVPSSTVGMQSVTDILTSVDVLGADRVESQHVDYSWELFSQAPGVQVTEFKQGTDAGRISFRGFNAEGRINAVKLLIDGIPSNENGGGMAYLDGVFPLNIDAIEIVRGTNDPRYGLYNIAGNVNVLTRTGGNDGQASMTVGSFGTREVQIAKGHETDSWTQNYTLAWRESDGYRDHADARKFALSGKWTHTSDDQRWVTGLSVRGYRNRALEAGYLTEQQALDDPRMSPEYVSADRGKRDIGQISLLLDGQLSDTLAWSSRVYFNHYENDRWVRFTEAGAQQERYNREAHYGVLSHLNWAPVADGWQNVMVEVGADLQRQDNTNRRNRTVERTTISPLRDWDYTLDTAGAYVQVVWQPTERLKLIPGYRIDHIGGHFDDKLTGQSASTYDYGLIRQPKLSALYELTEQASVYANWGRTFQIGVGRDSYRVNQTQLKPSINTGWEAGIKWQPLESLSMRLAYWEQRATDEVHTVLGITGTAGDVANIGKTLRKGFDVQANVLIDSTLSAWLSYSHQSARIVEPAPDAQASRGRQVENVPRYLVGFGVDWRPLPRWKFSAWGNGQGSYYVERNNTEGKFGQYFVLNLGATYTWRPDLDIGVQIKNVTDRNYAYAWYDSGSRGFSPADGRGLYATLNWKF